MGWLSGKTLDRILSTALVLCAIVLVGAVAQKYVFLQPKSHESPPVTHWKGWRDAFEVGHVLGKADASVTVIEFSDFECPYCRVMAPELLKAKTRFGDKVAIVYVHLPLRQHRFAIPAARAAECAHKEGRFWEFNEQLFLNQDSLGLKPWTEYAIAAGVKGLREFTKCIEVTTSLPSVESGRLLAKNAGVSWTPGIVINGWVYRELPPSEIIQTIERALRGDGPAPAER